MAKTFTKVRKWAEQVGAEVKDSEYFNSITVIFPSGKKFELSNRESTSKRVISRGRGYKWVGNPKGMYFKDIPKVGYGGYAFQSTQAEAIEKMSKYLKEEVNA